MTYSSDRAQLGGTSRSKLLAILGIALVIALAAGCGGSTTDQVTTARTADWRTIEVIDSSGERFAIDDFVGQPVFVENFATWCSNCRRQLGDTQKAAERAGDRAVFIALSVETSLGARDMGDYARDNGFLNIKFAVMTPELLAAINDAFGNSALNPPSTPKVVVGPDGEPGELVTGYESAGEILSALGLA